jgi:hypothetical protein
MFSKYFERPKLNNVMANAFRLLLCCTCLFTTAFWVSAQTPRDTAFVTAAAKNAIRLYNENIQGQTGLYVGSQYKQPRRTNDEHPFFIDFDWQTGDVDYNGESFLSVPILYDVTRDIVVIEHYYSGDEMVLVNSKVSAFSIGDRKFVHLTGPLFLPGLPNPGFYETLYTGKTQVVARHQKNVEEHIEGRVVEIHFYPKVKYYVLHNGMYERVSGKGGLLKLLGDKKSELRSFIQKEKIQFKKDYPAALARVAQHYDSLTPAINE